MRKTALQAPLPALLAAAIASAPLLAHAQPAAPPAPIVARSAPLPDSSPTPASPPREWKLALAQAGSGLAVTTASVAALYAVDLGTSALLTTLIAGPVAAGLVACAVGLTSTRHDGRCLPTMGAAMLTLPVVLTLLLNNTHEDPNRHTNLLTLGAVFVLLPPLLATTSWHLFKHPKPAPAITTASPLLSPRPRAPHHPKPRTSAAAGQLLVPLLASSF